MIPISLSVHIVDAMHWRTNKGDVQGNNGIVTND